MGQRSTGCGLYREKHITHAVSKLLACVTCPEWRILHGSFRVLFPFSIASVTFYISRYTPLKIATIGIPQSIENINTLLIVSYIKCCSPLSYPANRMYCFGDKCNMERLVWIKQNEAGDKRASRVRRFWFILPKPGKKHWWGVSLLVYSLSLVSPWSNSRAKHSFVCEYQTVSTNPYPRLWHFKYSPVYVKQKC